MTLGVTIRRAQRCDYAPAAIVTLSAYAPFTQPDDPYLDKLSNIARRDREAEVWVALAGSQVVGSLTWCPDGSPWREIAADDEGEFRMLAVSPAAQGRGVGAVLLNAALDRARAEGRRAVVLSTLPQMHAAHRLYERHGFAAAPERDWSPLPGIDLRAFTITL